jgi:2-aminobenzoate-CoA ligase
LPDATRQLWKEKTGIEITDGIGGTEMIHIYISSAGTQVRAGSIGQVVPGYAARIVDDDMQPVPPGTPGRLAVRGPTGCRYLDDARQSNYVKDGWNLPGDTFSMDQDGYFYYVARNDDMIISAGYNIAGPEVESALLQHPAVAECGVVGVPDDERGQIVMAYVALKPEYTADAEMVETLQNFVKQSIAPFKYPRRIQFIPALPRTETGKLQRFRLRQLATQA